MAMERTGWFSIKANPVRRGWYEVKLMYTNGAVGRLYWNGKRWLSGPLYMTGFPLLPGDQWRGLTAEVK